MFRDGRLTEGVSHEYGGYSTEGGNDWNPCNLLLETLILRSQTLQRRADGVKGLRDSAFEDKHGHDGLKKDMAAHWQLTDRADIVLEQEWLLPLAHQTVDQLAHLSFFDVSELSESGVLSHPRARVDLKGQELGTNHVVFRLDHVVEGDDGLLHDVFLEVCKVGV